MGGRVYCSSSSIIGSNISEGLLRILKGFLETYWIGGVELPSSRCFLR
jgi:hypothetical protein